MIHTYNGRKHVNSETPDVRIKIKCVWGPRHPKELTVTFLSPRSPFCVSKESFMCLKKFKIAIYWCMSPVKSVIHLWVSHSLLSCSHPGPWHVSTYSSYVHTYIRTYVLLRLPLYVNGGVYIFVPINVSTALYECSFISESFLQSNDLVSIAANRTRKVWFRTLARDDNTVMYAVRFICTQSCIHMLLHIL